MAIHPRLPSLAAEVIVDGSPLKEYDDENENESISDTTTISRYVEAVSNANFEIRVTFKKEDLAKKHGVRSSVLVDGITAHRMIQKRSRMEPQVVQTFRGVYSNVNGRTMEATFRFSELVLTEDDISLNRKMAASLGQIEVQLHFVKNIRNESRPMDIKRTLRSNEAMPAKIATLEALSHVTRGDEPKKVKCNWVQCEDADEKPFVKFIFKYRSNESLQHLCIVPRAQKPVPMPLEKKQVKPTATTPSQNIGSVTLSIEDIKVFLNHYTGQKSTWGGFDRAALEALLCHYKASSSTAANPKKEIKKECNATSSKVLKRSHEETRAMSQGAATDVLETGARPVKRRCLPKGGDDIIEID